MRRALRQTTRAAVSRPSVIPAPSGGWNARDELDAMHPLDAVELTNFFPTDGGVVTKKGYASHATGMTGDVSFLAEFDAGASRKMIAGSNGEIWDVTSAGAASSLASGFSSDKWQHAQFDPAGTALMGLVNGTDAPQTFDGTTVTGMTISGSGLTPANLDGINVFKSRTYFWDSSTQDFWYSSVNAMGGTLTKFPLGRVSGFGGNLVAMGTWNVDGGDGVNDMAVFCMSSGDVIVYNGDDPGSSWALVGVYRIGSPLSVRSVVKLGNDLAITTSDGYVPLSRVLPKGRVGVETVSDKIIDEVLRVTKSYKANYGWDIIHYPHGKMALFNVPVSTTKFDQHVINTSTGSWAKFTGWNGISWSLLNDELYFGSTDGVVYKADTGRVDGTADIHAIGQPAWDHLGARGLQKNAKLARLVGKTDATSLVYKLEVGTDFVNPSGQPDDVSPAQAGTLWGAAWGSAWPDESRIIDRWETVASLGDAFTTRVQVKSSTVGFDWYSTAIVYETGGMI